MRLRLLTFARDRSLMTVGYFASVLIGIFLGLIGGGGSILTVPVLVYLFGIEPVIATAYSLFIVGMTSLVGAVSKFRDGLVNIKTAVIFGIPAMIAVYLSRAVVVPMIPQFVTLGGAVITKAMLLMGLFALLMVFASISLLRDKPELVSESEVKEPQVFQYPMILIEGAIIGLLTGLVGAGGGFLIIPALVLFSKLPMKQAIGTSLVIIAAKSLLGFWGDLGQNRMDWSLLLTISSLAILGVFIGNWLSRKIDGEKLKQAFGIFVLLLGIGILLNEFWSVV
jgi:uncharacterized protein